MRIALIAPPYIPVPPVRYGGTELFVAQLARGLKALGVDVVVYACGESTVNTEVRWLYYKSEWPITGEIHADLKDLNHTSWALRDCWETADIVHLNNAPGLAFARFDGPKFVYTIHHPIEERLDDYYAHFPSVQYVTISRYQQQRVTVPNVRTIHHGVDLSQYPLQRHPGTYLSFIGRIAPVKGVHDAIAVARAAGIPLKIAGEIQPLHRDYWETAIKPHVDGKSVEYVGEVDLAAKGELLGNSIAFLFPIAWDEPFGLVLIEAMACGTPVLAFPGGSVPEIVMDGVSGHICQTVDDMVARARSLSFDRARVRLHVQQNFSVERMARDYCSLYAQVLRPETADMQLAGAAGISMPGGGDESDQTAIA